MAPVIPFEEEAQRTSIWARAFLHGPNGSGKSRGALELASRLFGGELHVTLINTEPERGRLYADRFRFSLIDLSTLGDFSPETFIAAVDTAESKHPGGIIVIDSTSHEWMGEGGVLSLADRFGDWKKVRPRHDDFVNRLKTAESHVIVACRAKMQYEVTEEERDGRARQVVSALGIGPVQDKDLPYEFNLIGSFEQATHLVTFTGHCDLLVGVKRYDMVQEGQAVADTYSEWLSDGIKVEATATAAQADVEALLASLKAEGIADEEVASKLRIARQGNRGKLSPEYVEDQLTKSKQRLARKASRQAAAATAQETEKSAPPGGGGVLEPTQEELAAAAG